MPPLGPWPMDLVRSGFYPAWPGHPPGPLCPLPPALCWSSRKPARGAVQRRVGWATAKPGQAWKASRQTHPRQWAEQHGSAQPLRRVPPQPQVQGHSPGGSGPRPRGRCWALTGQAGGHCCCPSSSRCTNPVGRWLPGPPVCHSPERPQSLWRPPWPPPSDCSPSRSLESRRKGWGSGLSPRWLPRPRRDSWWMGLDSKGRRPLRWRRVWSDWCGSPRLGGKENKAQRGQKSGRRWWLAALCWQPAAGAAGSGCTGQAPLPATSRAWAAPGGGGQHGPGGRPCALP